MLVNGIGSVACLGTGVMGHGVAFLAAKAGYEVRLYGRSEAGLRRGLEGIERVAALFARHGLMPTRQSGALGARLIPTTSLEEAVRDADFVMESVVEDEEIKRGVFRTVEAVCPAHAVLATNTSSLRLAPLSGALSRPERFVAVHFFNPPYLMPTVEICPGPDTLPETRAKAAAWVRSLGNMPIELEKEVQGFLINRIQAACLREALHIVEQGWASAETVDKAVAHALGRRYAATGPLETADMGGLDVFCTVLDQLSPGLSRSEKASPLVTEAVQRGDLGLKSGKGLFDWPEERAEARRAARERVLLEFLRKDKEREGGA